MKSIYMSLGALLFLCSTQTQSLEREIERTIGGITRLTSSTPLNLSEQSQLQSAYQLLKSVEDALKARSPLFVPGPMAYSSALQPPQASLRAYPDDAVTCISGRNMCLVVKKNRLAQLGVSKDIIAQEKVKLFDSLSDQDSLTLFRQVKDLSSAEAVEAGLIYHRGTSWMTEGKIQKEAEQFLLEAQWKFRP